MGEQSRRCWWDVRGVFMEQQGGQCVTLRMGVRVLSAVRQCYSNQVSYRSSGQGDSREDGEKWSDSEYILNVELEFPDGLLVDF